MCDCPSCVFLAQLPDELRLDNPSHARLPDDPWRYFTPEPGVVLVDVDKLETVRARAGGIERAEGHMLAAYEGRGEKRGPIHVTVKDDGWRVEDGNSTAAIARKHGWKLLPALVVANTQRHA